MVNAEKFVNQRKQQFLEDLFDLDLTPKQRETARMVLTPEECLVLLYHQGSGYFRPKILTEEELRLYERNDSSPRILQKLSYGQI